MKKAEQTKRDKAIGTAGGSTEDKQNEEYVLRYILACRDEAAEARQKRMDLNRYNFEMYHLEHDFSEKNEGQSTEVLPKEKMAVETTKSYFQQALADIGEWWRIVWTETGKNSAESPITPEEVYKMTNYMLKKAKYFDHIGDTVWYALLGALGITQITGKMRTKPKYTVRKEGKGESYRKILEMTEDKTWELALNEIPQTNYYPDPTSNELYEIFETFTDKYNVLALAEGDYAIYDKSEVEELSGYTGTTEESAQNGPTKEDQTGQTATTTGCRPRVKLTHFRGNIVDDVTGKLIYENVVATVANDTCLIQKPTPNPLWHQGSDIVAAPLMGVPGSVWHTALMDAPAKFNNAQTELFNLILDAAFSSVHGTKQLRTDWLSDSADVSGGIKQGSTIEVNSQMPIGGKVLEDVVTGQFPQQVLAVYNLLQQEQNAASLTTDIRSGMTPQRSTSATATVEQSNTITSVFNGIAKNLEVNKVQPELEKSWQTTAQNWDLIDKEVFISLFGEERGEALSQLDPEDVFAATVSGMKFEVFGISLKMKEEQNYQRYMTFLQSIAAAPMFQEAFVSKYDPMKFLTELAATLGIDAKRIEIDQKLAQEQAAQAAAQAPQEPQGPDVMSQIAGPDSLASIFGAGGGPQPAEGQVS